MKLTRRESQIFYFGLFLALIFAMDRLLFKNLNSKLADLRQEIQVTQTRLGKGLRQQRQREAILKEYKAFEKYFQLKGSDEEIVSAFLREIEKLSRDAGMSVSEIKPRGVNEAGPYKVYTIEVRSDSTFRDLIKFLYRLNDSELLIRAQNLSLNLADEKSENIKIILTLKGIAL